MVKHLRHAIIRAYRPSAAGGADNEPVPRIESDPAYRSDMLAVAARRVIAEREAERKQRRENAA